MINIWEYEIGSKIKLVDIQNKSYIGEVVCLWDSDELEADYDCLDLETDDAIYGFKPDEILSIERIEELPNAT